MALVDQWGRSVDVARLAEEEAAPTLTGVRQVWSGHPTRGLTPQRLASILLEAETTDPTRYLELAEEMEEKDLHYLGVLGTRKRRVAQLEITVEAASDERRDQEMADALRDWLRRDTLQTELFDLLDAIGKGLSVSEIIWDTSAKQYQPARLEWRDPRWFAFDRDGTTLKLREGAELRDLTPFKYITHVAKAKSGFPIRGGLARAVSWIWLFKNFGVKDWVAFGEVFGQPYRVGKYDPGATPEDKRKLLQAVASIGSDAAAIVPKSMVIELLENANKGGSIDVYDRLTRFLDEQTSKAVLGQTLTTEVTQGGGNRALGEVHAGVADDIQDADAQQLQATLNRDLTRPFIDLNYGPQARYPRLLIGRTDELTLRERLDYTLKFVPQGIRVEASQVRDRLGWEDPAPDAALLTVAAPVMPPSAPGEAPLAQHATRATRALAAHAEQSEGAPETRAVDTAIDELVADSGWTPVVRAMTRPLTELLADATTLDQVRERLADAIRQMDPTALTDVLTNAGFALRAGAALGADDQGAD